MVMFSLRRYLEGVSSVIALQELKGKTTKFKDRVDCFILQFLCIFFLLASGKREIMAGYN